MVRLSRPPQSGHATRKMRLRIRAQIQSKVIFGGTWLECREALVRIKKMVANALQGHPALTPCATKEIDYRGKLDRPEFHRQSGAALRVAPFKLYR